MGLIKTISITKCWPTDRLYNFGLTHRYISIRIIAFQFTFCE